MSNTPDHEEASAETQTPELPEHTPEPGTSEPLKQTLEPGTLELGTSESGLGTNLEELPERTALSTNRQGEPGAPASNAAGPTTPPERTALSTNPQAEPGAPASNAAGPTTPPERTALSTNPQAEPGAPGPIRKVDPMQGMKLEAILNELVAYFGWEEMGYRINIRCFNEDPSIGSSLKFLRKTPWARTKVDTLFLTMRAEQAERFGLGTLD